MLSTVTFKSWWSADQRILSHWQKQAHLILSKIIKIVKNFQNFKKFKKYQKSKKIIRMFSLHSDQMSQGNRSQGSLFVFQNQILFEHKSFREMIRSIFITSACWKNLYLDFFNDAKAASNFILEIYFSHFYGNSLQPASNFDTFVNFFQVFPKLFSKTFF